LVKLTAVPFIDTVELETVALKVAVLPATGKAAVQLLLLFQESLAPLPVHAPLAAKATGLPIREKHDRRIKNRRGAFFMSHISRRAANGL
jgi:hypothetical protein